MEKVGRFDRVNDWFDGYVAQVAGPDVEPDSLSAIDIRALPRLLTFLETPPFPPVHEPEAVSGSVRRLTATEALERLARADRFIERATLCV